MKGSLDAVHNGECYGWALDEETQAPVEVSIFIDGVLAGSMRADSYRRDLEEAGLRDGRLAFRFRIPQALCDGGEHDIELRAQGGELIASRESILLTPQLTAEEFRRQRPWIDAEEAEFEAMLDSLTRGGSIDPKTEQQVRFFREHGYLIIEGAVPHALIDKTLADIERAWRDLPPLYVINRERREPTLMRDIAQTPGFRQTSFRYMDFHNTSEACAEIMMLPAALAFARLCFQSEIAAMQTLLFENGSEQPGHQDFAFVHSLRPACLMGAWVALEDVHSDSGPLFYWDASHQHVPLHVFENGSVLADGYGPHVRAYNQYLETTCSRLGLARRVFTPRKGDLLIWHSALVHGGLPRTNPAFTRKSMVSHYTTRAAYPYDRRNRSEPPLTRERNGGIYYAFRHPDHAEGRYSIE